MVCWRVHTSYTRATVRKGKRGSTKVESVNKSE
jgi:hypothetical protein